MRWLLLRGLAREQRHWGEFRKALEARVEAVECIDLPGAGTEHARRSPLSIAAIAEDVRARFRPGGARWGLCAVSLGGMVAMQWCFAHPDDFAAVVLVNTSAANLSAPWRRLSLRVVPSVLLALGERDRARREERILRMTTRMRGDVAALAHEFAGFHAQQPMARQNVLRQLAAAARFRAPAALKPPALVVSGAKDPFTDPQCPRRIARRFGAQLVQHPEAGHDLATDDPAWLATQVAQFERTL